MGARRGGRGYLTVPGYGPYIHIVAFKNIEVYGEKPPVTPSATGFRPGWEPATGAVFLQGLSEAHNVHGVVFDNVTIHGQALTLKSPGVEIGDFASGIEFTITPANSQGTEPQIGAKPVSR